MVIPLTLFIIFMLIYFNPSRSPRRRLCCWPFPFSLVGSFWLLYLLTYNIGITVWVVLLPLPGLTRKRGWLCSFTWTWLHQWRREGKCIGSVTLRSIMHGAVKRIRPKIMTVCVIFAGLIPIMFSHGAGADVMKRIAAPMVGGVITSTILELIIYPAIYLIWRVRALKE